MAAAGGVFAILELTSVEDQAISLADVTAAGRPSQNWQLLTWPFFVSGVGGLPMHSALAPV
jgi:hypothetical protein